MNFELIGIFFYLLIQFTIGIVVSRRIASEQDYFLAGRKLGPMLATFSIFATWFGAESCIGSAGAVYQGGLSGGRADPFGYTLCLVFMGVFFASRLWKRNLVTLGDLFRERYSLTIERLAILLMVPTSLMWAAAQIRAFGQVLSASSTLNVEIAITIAAGLVIVYTVTGGLLADVMTDFIQGICLIGGLIVLFAVLMFNGGGPEHIWSQVDSSRLSLIPAEGGSLLSQMESWIIPIGGSLVAQELISRILAARSPEVARKSTLMAASIYLFVGLIPLSIGLFGPQFMPGLEEHEQILPALARTHLHGFLYVAFAGALVSAILSTVDSTLLAISSLTAHNIVVPMLKNPSERKKVFVARLGVVLSGLIAYIMAFYSDGIYELVEAASSFGSSGILIIMIFGLYGTFGSSWSAGAALVVGVSSHAISEHVFELETPYLLSIASALTVFVGVEFLLRAVQSLGWKPRAIANRELS